MRQVRRALHPRPRMSALGGNHASTGVGIKWTVHPLFGNRASARSGRNKPDRAKARLCLNALARGVNGRQGADPPAAVFNTAASAFLLKSEVTLSDIRHSKSGVDFSRREGNNNLQLGNSSRRINQAGVGELFCLIPDFSVRSCCLRTG